ncbi:AzlC family ABC transporter permease [Aerococcaceae bacterium NML191292]|nr:AzlC family ABC transporter permease [Aerococcaceae bacterium NML191292]
MKEAFKVAFPRTIPIFAAYLFLGISYGLFAINEGVPAYYPVLMSIVIYAGSMEFVTIRLLLSIFSPLTAFLLTLMVNARHLFYGLAMLTPFKSLGWEKYWVIFGLGDESFAIHTSLDIPAHIERRWVYFHVTWLNQCYWFIGTLTGVLLGKYIPFDTTGIEFVLSALFLVNLLEQLLRQRQYFAIAVGILSGISSLLFFGAKQFMLPAMLGMLIIFSIDYWRKGWQL